MIRVIVVSDAIADGTVTVSARSRTLSLPETSSTPTSQHFPALGGKLARSALSPA